MNVPKRRFNFFVSYAHRNQELAENFIEILSDHLRPSKAYDYTFWMDSRIFIGEEWEKQIIGARNNCDFGLLFVSPSFLASKFIVENELAHFLNPPNIKPTKDRWADILQGSSKADLVNYVF